MSPAPNPRILIVDADPALWELLSEWLGAVGCTIVEEAPDLVLVDVPSPRNGGAEVLARLRARHGDTPLVALSSQFFSRVEQSGAVARGLGVAAVLPKPVAREALIAAVRTLLSPPR